jgi:hypothetical protein
MNSIAKETVVPTHYVTGWETWAAHLETRLHQSVHCGQDGLGHLEEHLSAGTRELQRQALERAAQAKADATPPHCPVCGKPLTRRQRNQARTVTTRFGPVRIRRTRGWCSRCKLWRFPADVALRLDATGAASPAVQEAAALLVAQMPAAEAAAILQRLTGIECCPATLEREARRQGERGHAHRDAMNAVFDDWDSLVAAAQRAATKVPAMPFTLVIEIDAWNIRERDGWGETAALTQAGQPPSRWHWVYGATVFRLDQRGQTAGGRPIISERGYVMTRGGVDRLRALLWAEAMRRGLAQAARVLVVADGAVWIWNLVEDRFGEAHQLLDYYHASQHLWAVAAAAHGEGTTEARRWVEPLLEQLRGGHAAKVIRRLEQLELRVTPPVAETVARERQYFQKHRERMGYATAAAQGWPLGSGAMESSCRQYQCRFKRPGQYWSEAGDEALLVLQEYWRNGRWAQLFPHTGCCNPSLN